MKRAAFLALILLAPQLPAAASKVSIVTGPEPGRATKHGVHQLQRALEAKGHQVEITRHTTSASGKWVVLARHSPEHLIHPESLRITRADLRFAVATQEPAIAIEGADDRGLMYGLLDVADWVGWASDTTKPFSEVRYGTEKPDVSERGLSIYTFHRAAFEQRFFEEAYWERYFDMLARNRFNSFVLVFGYENGGYFAPAYPWFFDVEGFPETGVPNITKEQQARNLRALNRLIELAHDRGLRFTVGLWDHIYRGGVQAGGMADADPDKPGPDRVSGLNQTNLLAYSRAGLAKFLKLVPAVDALQFRMHDESGLKPGQEQHAFWKAIFEVVKTERPALPLTLRAKGLPDEIIDLGLEQGLNVRVATKYWMEQMGMPFHPTHIPKQNQHDRRHGYADLLRYPRRYQMHWRLWSAGTVRVLLWGDPEFARRFAASTHLYDGEGFEVTEPLGTKMQAQPHGQKPFELLRPQYRYYDYEFERYWHFYQVFGRLAYNPETPSEVWDREFARRFGPDAGPHVAKALHRASWILPRLNASTFPYRNFPTTRGWAEKQRWCDLPEYARVVEGSDTEQFQGIAEAARNRIEGVDSPKLSPLRNASWFSDVSRDVLTAVTNAENRIGSHRSKEFDSTMVDLRILAHLAGYHAERIDAGLHYACFTRSQDAGFLDLAIASERFAVEQWEQLVKAAGDVYADEMLMGRRSMDLCGHWRDELAALRKGLAALEEERRLFTSKARTELTIAHVPVRRVWKHTHIPSYQFTATVTGPDPVKSVRLLVQTGDSRPDAISMTSKGDGRYEAIIPPARFGSGAEYSIVAEDAKGRAATFPAKSGTIQVRVHVLNDDPRPATPPVLEHVPAPGARAGQPLRITATVRDPSGVQWVRLRFRPVNQTLDYETLEMLPTGTRDEYAATIPGDKILSQWDFMYFFEVMDELGNGKIYPDFERETPYVIVKLDR